jgi:tetratricopeptide (TPR) repeat protein
VSAADLWFGEQLPALLERVSEAEMLDRKEWWEQTHERLQKMRTRWDELVKLREERPSTSIEEAELATLTATLYDTPTAIEAYRSALKRFPDEPRLRAGLGRLLVEEEDPSGVPYLEKAAEAEPEIATDCYRLLYWFYSQRGDDAAAKVYEEKAVESRLLDVYAARQARSIEITDDFLPHDLQAGDVESLRKQLERCTHVGEAYFVRKLVRAGNDRTFRTLVVLPKSKLGLEKDNTTRLRQVSENVSLDCQFTIYAPSEAKAWRKRLSEVEGSLVYKQA